MEHSAKKFLGLCRVENALPLYLVVLGVLNLLMVLGFLILIMFLRKGENGKETSLWPNTSTAPAQIEKTT